MLIYNFILNILFLPIIIILGLISLFNYRLRITFVNRLSIKRINLKEPPVWFHCSSLGEFNAIKNVILKLKQKYPYIFVTTLTNTGYDAAVKLLGKDKVSILPLDFNFIIRKFIKKLNPKLLIIEETEIWPNLIYEVYKKNIPIVYVNAIMTDKSFRFYKKVKKLISKLLNSITVFFIQNENTKKFLQYFGVDNKKIKYIGNIKFDLQLDRKINNSKIKTEYKLKNKLIITCGSIRKGEEDIFINVYKHLKKKFKNLVLIFVPRHLERINEIIQILNKYEVSYSLLSALKNEYEVLIVDKMGVLLDFYAVSDISYIGGTISPIGGHNPLEAAILGKPVIFGKYIGNNREAFETLLKTKGGIMIHNKHNIIDVVEKLLSNKKLRNSTGKNAKKVILQNKGASDKITNYILKKFI